MQQVAIVAPTASGKSDVAMAVAHATGAHIVAVDAMQVYRGMDIGTAKPTAADRAGVPHHCIDVVNPDERFSVAEYKQNAVLARTSIAAAGAHAVFVAGTGLYLTAVIDDLQLPGEWPAVRAELAKIGYAGWAAAEVKGGGWDHLTDVARRMDRVLDL